MAKVNDNLFLEALADFMLAALSLSDGLFTHRADEATAPDPYAILRIYDGETPWVPAPVISIQSMTIATSNLVAMQFAQEQHDALTDSVGRPLRKASLTGFRINAILNLRRPGLIGNDDKNRPQVAFNFDCEVVAA